MTRADVLTDLTKSRNELLDYKDNIERQLQQAQNIINIALNEDSGEGVTLITEQDAVWYNYLLNIYIDIKRNLRLIDGAIKDYNNKLKGEEPLEFQIQK